MSDNSLEVGLKARLSAQRHMLAFALGLAHRDMPDAADAIDEIGRKFIADFMREIEALRDQHPSRNLVAAEYVEEISSITRLAGQIATGFQR